MARPRVAELDFIRAVAILMVVLLHVSAAYVAYSPVDSHVFYIGLIVNQWARICLPLFVFVSGFGLFYKYGQNNQFKIKDFYLRRFYTVFVPYLVWSFIYMIFRDVFNSSFQFIGLPIKDALMSYLNWTFKENIHTPIWFVMMIVQLYVLFPILLKLVRKISKPGRAIAANFIFFLILSVYFRYFMVASGIYAIDVLQKYYYVNFLGWYFYFILGGIAAQHWEEFKENELNKFWLLLSYIFTTFIVILEAYFGFLKYGQAHLGVYTSTRPTVLINSMAAIPFTFFLAKKAMKWDKAAKFFKAISKYSYGIFFVHPQVLTVMKKLVGLIYGTYTTRTFHLVLIFVMTTLGSYFFCHIVEKTPFKTVLLGIDKNK